MKQWHSCKDVREGGRRRGGKKRPRGKAGWEWVRRKREGGQEWCRQAGDTTQEGTDWSTGAHSDHTEDEELSRKSRETTVWPDEQMEWC